MSDDLNDEQILLASAYLDGDVTSAERAQVDADPQLLAEVDRLGAVRTALADTATTAISTREQHLAAALGAWDRLSDAERSGDNSGGIPAVATDPAAAAGAATVTAPTPLADRRNKRSSQKSSWMLTAAAVVLVIAGGGLIARGIIDSGSSDDAESNAVELPAQLDQLTEAAADEALAEEPAADEPAEAAAELAPQVEAGIESTEGRPDEVERIDSPESLAVFAEQQLAFEASRADEDVFSASEPIAADEPDAAAEEGADTDTAPAETVSAQIDSGRVGTDFTCGLVDRIIGEAEYGSGIFPQFVAIGVDNAETEVIAYRIETCEIVARAPLGG